MESKKLHIYVTGFGPFHTIKVNPSSAIGEAVSKRISQELHIPIHFEELEVSVEAVSKYFEQLEEKVAGHMKDSTDEFVLLVHIGVHSSEMKGLLRAEVRGYNELDATITDVRGNELNHIPINASLSVKSYLESAFVEDEKRNDSFESLIQDLNTSIRENDDTDEGRQQASWIISRDAGRYLCNYTLYRGIELQNRWRDRVFAIFVHVTDPLQGDLEQEGELNPTIEAQTVQVYSFVSQLADIVNVVR